MKLHGILESVLYVTDLDAAERFYTKVLGLTPFQSEPGRHVFFRCEQAMLLLFNPEATSKQMTAPGSVVVPLHGTRGPGHLAFRITSAEVGPWRERLHKAGVAVEAEILWPNGGHSLYFRDPSGNSVELATPTLWGLPEDK